ncbi:MAG: cytochrome P460 family protein [Acetobacteraceae bacterium]|nr:cytochrome P460 family protein [Acetobacteraceae bacterium]
MRRTVPAILAAAGLTAALGLTIRPGESVRAQDAAGWQPRYNDRGDLLLPVGYRNWVFLGSPLTPNALNGGHAGFPEFHNVYIPSAVLDEYKRSGSFPEGSIWVKELQLTLPGQNPDGSRTEPSGRGYFPGAFNGMDVMVKDSKHCAEMRNWCFYNFGHHALPYAASAAIAPLETCASCHIATADKDMHFFRFYSALQ